MFICVYSFSEFYNKNTFQGRDMTVRALGELVAVKYSADGRWYRAKCVNVDPEPDKEKVKVCK